jgi:4-hydroxybenzoate polyprenyltransferase
MNFKKILIVGVSLALVFMLVAMFGGLGPKFDLITIGTPLTIFLVLVVLIINTYYQAQILETLRSFGRQDDYPEDDQ